MDTWETYKWFTKVADFYVYYKRYPSRFSSPIYSDLDENWRSKSEDDEDLTLSIRKPFSEIIMRMEMTFVILCFHFSRKPIPFFPIKIIVIAILYGEVDIIDHNFSFIWIRALLEWP